MKNKELKDSYEELTEELRYYKNRVNEHSQIRPSEPGKRLDQWRLGWNIFHNNVARLEKIVQTFKDEHPEYFI